MRQQRAQPNGGCALPGDAPRPGWPVPGEARPREAAVLAGNVLFRGVRPPRTVALTKQTDGVYFSQATGPEPPERVVRRNGGGGFSCASTRPSTRTHTRQHAHTHTHTHTVADGPRRHASTGRSIAPIRLPRYASVAGSHGKAPLVNPSPPSRDVRRPAIDTK